MHQLLVASLLALHGLIVLVGPALHALPGFGHPGPRAVARVDGTPADQATWDQAPHADCPICHFAAQAALPDGADGRAKIEVVAIRPPDTPPDADRQVPPHPSRPRAPPLA